MPTLNTPGFTGFQYGRFSSNNKRAIGKMTDSNHLHTLSELAPAKYDKDIISIYTQSAIMSNDFLDLVNQGNTYYIDRSDAWQWNIEVPFSYTKIVDIPATTLSKDKIGIDGDEFQFVLDSNEFSQNETVSLGNKIHGPQVYITYDPVPQGKGWLYTATLSSSNPQSDYLDKKWLSVGVDVIGGSSVIGEFTQTLPGLGKMADSMTMFESMSSAIGRSHRITKWADQILIDGQAVKNMPRNAAGDVLDLVAYVPKVRNSTNKIGPSSIRWEPYVETLLRKKILEDRAWRYIYQKAGVYKDNGSKQGDLKKTSDGVIPRMRNHGHYLGYNRGEFAQSLLRTAFGDLFYGRVSMKNRHVKLYTNEAGFDVFQQSAKEDALGSGLTFTTNIDAVKSGGIKISDPSQHLVYGWAFDSTYSRETGLVELVHLDALEERRMNAEFGQNKKASPLFMAFDISGDGGPQSLGNNIREVRLKGAPSMTWGYVDGRQHHLGHAASQGMSSANMDPGYQIWFEDRTDVFIEDLSRTFLIEERPQY